MRKAPYVWLLFLAIDSFATESVWFEGEWSSSVELTKSHFVEFQDLAPLGEELLHLLHGNHDLIINDGEMARRNADPQTICAYSIVNINKQRATVVLYNENESIEFDILRLDNGICLESEEVVACYEPADA